MKKEPREINENDTKIETNPINIKSKNENIKLTLVEKIEELGFIPSIDKNDKTNAA